MRFLILLSITVVMFQRCKSHCDCSQYDKLWTDSVARLPSFSVTAEDLQLDLPKAPAIKPNWRFGVNFYQRKDSLFLVYVSMNGYINFIDPKDSTHKRRSFFPYEAGNNRVVLMRVIGDTIHLVDQKDQIYYQLSINQDYTTTRIKRLPLNSFVNIPGWFVHYNPVAKQFDYQYPYLALPYGKTNGKNLMDTSACLLINTETLEVRSLLPVPQCYQSCYVEDENTSLAFQDNDIVGMFSYYGSFLRQKLDGSIVRQTHLPFCDSFPVYDPDKVTNLAYKRNYELRNSRNVYVMVLEDRSVVVVKRRKKEQVNAPNTYRLYRYDANGKLTNTGVTDERILPWSITPQKKGFLAVNDSLTKMISYAFE